MKENELSMSDYSYQKYSPEFKRMRKDLLRTAVVYFFIAIALFASLTVTWRESPSLISFLGISLGGVFGALIPWLGVERKHMTGFPLGESEHFSAYEQRLQVVIWKFKNNADVFVISMPYLIWFVYQAFQQPLSKSIDFGHTLFIMILAMTGTFAYAMSVLAVQVRWSIRDEIKKHRSLSK